VLGNIGIAFCAGAAAAINHVVDERIDQKMSRTTNRPVAQGRVSQTEAIAFAAVLAFLGAALLAITINVLTAVLTVASLVGYAFIYTMFLKRATPQNIVIGGLAGAAPPLLGWTAVTGEIHAHGLLLVLIIFAWTPPHFWALAIHRKEEYAAVGIPMLPVTHGNRFTALHILLYTILMFLITLLPYITLLSGWIYAIAATLLGLRFLYWSIEILREKNPDAPMATFKFSITYLMVLFIAMLADHWILGTPA
jgi:protoheme IX farnesyltransferase